MICRTCDVLQVKSISCGSKVESWSLVAGKSLPVHCVVEAVSALEESRVMWRRKPVVETDSYVIIPVNTAFQELVQVALHRLGYPRDSASAAKGQFQSNLANLVRQRSRGTHQLCALASKASDFCPRGN